MITFGVNKYCRRMEYYLGFLIKNSEINLNYTILFLVTFKKIDLYDLLYVLPYCNSINCQLKQKK